MTTDYSFDAYVIFQKSIKKEPNKTSTYAAKVRCRMNSGSYRSGTDRESEYVRELGRR